MSIRIKMVDITHLRDYSQHLKNLSPENKFSRFGHTASDHTIDSLMLQIAYNLDDHYFWVAYENNTQSWKEEFVGWGHLAKDGDSWELAVSVNSDKQQMGIGNSLISEMLTWAKVHHVHEVYMHCIEDNKIIQHLATKHKLKTRERSHGERTSAIELPEPSFLEVNRQRWVEHTALMEEYQDLRKRMTDLWFGS